MVFVYKKLAQFAVGCALPPRRSESPLLLVASAGLVYWVARFFLLGTKARILGLTLPKISVNRIESLDARMCLGVML